MRAAIYNPYLDTLGGGERYTLSFAKVLLELGWNVDIEWKSESLKEKIKSRFGINLDGLNFVDDVKRGDGYDVCFWVSDGSIPTLRSRNNILHFQIPFKDVNGRSLLNKMKLFRINKIVCNSKFTKSVIDQEYGVDSIVVYPPCDVAKIKSKNKSNIILYVGRFSKLVQNKGQEILIDQFKKFYNRGYSDWKLILAGGVEVGSDDLVKDLEEMLEKYPIEILKSPDFKTIVNYYGVSRFFWSASGYGTNEEKNPEKVEHFGMTTVEAMSGGCVPIVYNAGGQKEIIENGKNGFLWSDKNELVSTTIKLIKDRAIGIVSKQSIATSTKYSYEEFKKQITQLL